jgi:hypothetical protein
MVNQLTPPSLAEEDVMSLSFDYAKKFFDFLKSLMAISVFLLLFLIFCFHYQELNHLCEAFLAEAQTINLDHVKFSAFGAEVDGSFSQQQIASQLETEGVDDPATQDKVSQVVLGLKPEEVDRLMYVGTLQASCDFTKPAPRTKRFIEVDRELRAKGLVAFKPDPVTYERLKQHGDDPDNGLPLSCYDMTLTDQGFNVKTALVKTLGTMFKSNANNPRLAMK